MSTEDKQPAKSSRADADTPAIDARKAKRFLGLRERSLRETFLNLAWPAAAGNVFWAFIGVFNEAVQALDQNQCFYCAPDSIVDFHNTFSPIARLLLLMVFSAYLTINWLRHFAEDASTSSNVRVSHYAADFFHLSAIVGCAHATVAVGNADSYSLPLGFWLTVYFLVTSLAHILPFWRMPNDDGQINVIEGYRFLLGGASLLGLLTFHKLVPYWVIDYVLSRIDASLFPVSENMKIMIWNDLRLTLAVGLALLAWYVIRRSLRRPGELALRDIEDALEGEKEQQVSLPRKVQAIEKRLAKLEGGNSGK